MLKPLLKSLKKTSKLNHLHKLMKTQIILKMKMTNQKMNQMMKLKKINLSRLKKKLHPMMKKMKLKLHPMMKKVKKLMKPHLTTKKMMTLRLQISRMKNLSLFLTFKAKI